MEENERNEAPQHTDNELAHLLSDEVNRDLRRYACRFNDENE